jgi:predicted AlkP superfamily phosphohydrolase/phosphomutase
MTRKRAAVVEHLIRNHEWDLCVSVFVCVDRVQHFFWRHYDARHPQHSKKDAEKYGEVIPCFYEMADEIVGRLIDLASDATTVIMSDHGFGPLHKLVNLDRWMAREGFMAWKETPIFDSKKGFNRALVGRHLLETEKGRVEEPGPSGGGIRLHLGRSDGWAGVRVELTRMKLSSFYQIGFVARSSSEGILAEVFDLSKEEQKLEEYRLNQENRAYLTAVSSTNPLPCLALRVTSYGGNPTGIVEINRIFLTELDWTKTIAYSFPNSSEININQRGREFFGQIQPGKKSEELKDVIAEKLMGLKVDGKPLVDRVYRKERLYWGERIGQVPDLIFTHRDYRYVAGSEFKNGKGLVSWSKTTSGTHRFEGILVMRGKGIKMGVRLPECSMEDVAPTVLHMLGLPVPRDMDGKVLLDAFEREYATPVRYSADERATRQVAQPTKEDKRILDRLKALGYLA